MNKWSEPVIYPWGKWNKSLWKKHSDFEDYSVDMENGFIGFFLYWVLIVIITPLLAPLSMLLITLQTIEYPIGLLIDVTVNNIDKLPKKSAIIILIPSMLLFIIGLTWGLPKLIYVVIKQRRERKKEKTPTVVSYSQGDIPNIRIRRYKDFTPTKQIKQHRL